MSQCHKAKKMPVVPAWIAGIQIAGMATNPAAHLARSRTGFVIPSVTFFCLAETRMSGASQKDAPDLHG